MRAKICDRCGKTYMVNKRHETYCGIKGDFLGGISYITWDHRTDASSDLCDDCMHDLIYDFMVYDESKQKGEEK